MIETIPAKDLPRNSVAVTQQKVFNLVKNNFIPIDPGQTKYVTENEFRFIGIMKIIGFLMPGAFKKQTQKYLNLLKLWLKNKEYEYNDL